MANETKVGVAVFAVLVGVFGFVLYRKYDDQLTALAALHGPANGAEEGGQATDPLAPDAEEGLGTVTDGENTGDLAALDDPFGPDPEAPDGGAGFGGDPPAPQPESSVEIAQTPAADDDWSDPQGDAAVAEWNMDPVPAETAQTAEATSTADWPADELLETGAPPAEQPTTLAESDDPFDAELNAFDTPVDPNAVAMTDPPAEEPMWDEPAPTTGAVAEATEFQPTETADAADANAWPTELEPTSLAAETPVEAVTSTDAMVAETDTPADSTADDGALELWGDPAADATEPAPTMFAETPAETPAPAEADPLFPDDAPAELAATEFAATEPTAPEQSMALNPMAAEPSTVEMPFDPAPAAPSTAEPTTVAMAELSVSEEPVAENAPSEDGGFFLEADPAPTELAASPAPTEDEGLWNVAESNPPATDAPAASLAADASAMEDSFAGAENPAAALEPAAPAMDDAALWGGDEPSSPAAPEIAAAAPVAAGDDAFFPAPTEPAAPAAMETAATEATVFDAPPMMEPAPEPTPDLAPVELAATPPAADMPAPDLAAADVPAAPVMAEWPDLNAPPAAPSTPKPAPAESLAAEEPDSGLTPAAFAPEANLAAPNGPGSRPVRTADGESAMPFRFSGPNDRKVAEVQTGESYWAISKRAYGAAKYFKALARYNALRIRDPRNLQPGMKVICPPPSVLLAYDTDLAEAERASESRSSNAGWSGYGVDEQGRPVYMVASGDTLGAIAQKHLGRASRAEQIYALNRDKIRDPRRLKPGVLLNLPADATGVRRRVENAMR
ncbi:LysM peptidoglycan-binding domain-containing protein [Alienimonas chondri]|uniref:LysM domain-containing protein n=1 Tax=Alienimonas chondri TaxID=2681879 RepID=A0ABX1VD14_9PLAN|nr:LysM domain-containing protein [Alienimonas chondri]NNJ25993.1 hypothetical protein [Alienimonas chondri]